MEGEKEKKGKKDCFRGFKSIAKVMNKALLRQSFFRGLNLIKNTF